MSLRGAGNGGLLRRGLCKRRSATVTKCVITIGSVTLGSIVNIVAGARKNCVAVVGARSKVPYVTRGRSTLMTRAAAAAGIRKNYTAVVGARS